MGIVLTVNKINNFPATIATNVTAEDIVKVDDLDSRAKTKIRPLDETLSNLNKYEIEHDQKYSVEGSIQNIDFNEILKKYKFNGYKGIENFYIVSKNKFKIQHSALSRLRKKTNVQCIPYLLDLTVGVKQIIANRDDIEIIGVRFKEINLPNLQSVGLSGGEVNESADWERFIDLPNVVVSTITVILEDDRYDSGIKLLINNQGVFYSFSNISHETLVNSARSVLGSIVEADEEEE